MSSSGSPPSNRSGAARASSGSGSQGTPPGSRSQETPSRSQETPSRSQETPSDSRSQGTPQGPPRRLPSISRGDDLPRPNPSSAARTDSASARTSLASAVRLPSLHSTGGPSRPSSSGGAGAGSASAESQSPPGFPRTASQRSSRSPLLNRLHDASMASSRIGSDPGDLAESGSGLATATPAHRNRLSSARAGSGFGRTNPKFPVLAHQPFQRLSLGIENSGLVRTPLSPVEGGSRGSPAPLPTRQRVQPFIASLTLEPDAANKAELQRLIEIYGYRIQVAAFSKLVSFAKMELFTSSLKNATTLKLADFVGMQPLPRTANPDPRQLERRKQEIKKQITQELNEQRRFVEEITSLGNRRGQLLEMLPRIHNPELFRTSMESTLKKLSSIPDSFDPHAPFPIWQPFGERRTAEV